MHVGHHVAQKSSSTTLPRSSCASMTLPSSATKRNCTGSPVAGGSANNLPSASMTMTTPDAITMNRLIMAELRSRETRPGASCECGGTDREHAPADAQPANDTHESEADS